MLQENEIGTFRGRELIQKRGSVGGSRNVFVKLQGIKNELVYPTFGGIIMNPFKGPAKMFAGDLCWYKTNDKGVRPEIYLLKTYKALGSSGTSLFIERDGYKHKPFSGDILMKAPDVMGGSGEGFTVTAVTETENNGVKAWQLTMSDDMGNVAEGTIFVEAKAQGDTTMLVKTVNAIIDCDCDFFDYPNIVSGTNTIADLNGNDYDSARYFYTPALGGLMYIHKMSPMPQCVLDLNLVNVNGWYKMSYLNLPAAELAYIVYSGGGGK